MTYIIFAWTYLTAFTTGLVWNDCSPEITWKQRFWVVVGMTFFWPIMLAIEAYEAYTGNSGC